MRRGGQVKKKGTSGKYIKEVNPVATGIKYMNKFNTSSAVGKINANDEDPSDNNSHKDYEGKMVRAQMRVINRYSKDIYNMIEDDAQLEAWVQSKLTKATDYIQSVKHYLRDYKQEKK